MYSRCGSNQPTASYLALRSNKAIFLYIVTDKGLELHNIIALDEYASDGAMFGQGLANDQCLMIPLAPGNAPARMCISQVNGTATLLSTGREVFMFDLLSLTMIFKGSLNSGQVFTTCMQESTGDVSCIKLSFEDGRISRLALVRLRFDDTALVRYIRSECSLPQDELAAGAVWADTNVAADMAKRIGVSIDKNDVVDLFCLCHSEGKVDADASFVTAYGNGLRMLVVEIVRDISMKQGNMALKALGRNSGLYEVELLLYNTTMDDSNKSIVILDLVERKKLKASEDLDDIVKINNVE
ncbi:hypothetical protein MPSEU_000263100 [Mayamaea pseudoterrestris]|nr:hypothetical protein MPSEU_000263100 [Mayamaea pseudoterrestris]